MTLEIEGGLQDDGLKRICGGCITLVRDPRVFEGAKVMVSPKSDFAKRTGRGDSAFFGKVEIAFAKTKKITDRSGVIHFIVPTAVDGIGSIEGHSSEHPVNLTSLGHELRPLP